MSTNVVQLGGADINRTAGDRVVSHEKHDEGENGLSALIIVILDAILLDILRPESPPGLN